VRLAATVLTALIVLHAVDGQEVSVNPAQITTLHAQRDEANKLVVHDVVCVVGLASGKFVSVAESCSVVRSRLP
jgi:hypothetical protein